MTTRRNISLGDIVIYFFRTVRAGAPIGRPAIVTSFGPDDRHIGPARATWARRLNLHVFFEPGDRESRRESVKSSMGTRDEMLAQDMTNHARMDVPELVSGTVADAATSVWCARGGAQ